ncbi:tRNA (adenine(58)-N(1))-methyltransferase catalytic subunit TRMT61A [Porphyridium purpureum]|uniref:tRNA (adenine(58)-N(1))-methyltransferase n=1 Tax=Porphyridium purpureum TaxID=35688 RepID=A0A5J4YKH1_PORPP|nr:tRNA (adenine(58)-N(1))-methyltransferase catalytic subunit TRMT61A [Porphyridium purpureum]|eukprot:POR1545..scf244_11
MLRRLRTKIDEPEDAAVTESVLEDVSERATVGHPPVVAEGDVVIVGEKYPNISHEVVRAGHELQNRYGRFRLGSLIGKPVGRRWKSEFEKAGKGACFVNVLAPTPELWTVALQHRTQVVYSHDIALITAHLELNAGSVVLEAGTGSCSMTFALARTVAPHGTVLSFDVDEERVRSAQQEIKLLKLDHVVKVEHRNVVTRGFPESVVQHSVDAVFLDLPDPNNVIREAAHRLKPNGALACFSPCVEQVQLSLQEIRGSGLFYDVRTVTNTTRQYLTEAERFPVPDLGIDNQIRRGGTCAMAASNATTGGAGKTDHDEARAYAAISDDEHADPEMSVPAVGRKRPRGKEASRAVSNDTTDVTVALPLEYPTVPLNSRPHRDMKGHTSYLTFAYRIPYLGTEENTATVS